MPKKIWKVGEVFGIGRDLPTNYVERFGIDDKLINNLTRDQHLVIYGSSKQGKTCLRKHCLQDVDYIVVSCLNNMDLRQLHSVILKSAGYVVQESSTRTIDGKAKVEAKFGVKFGIPGIAKATLGTGAEVGAGVTDESITKHLELDPSDANEIIGALQEIKFTRYIVLEDFHYLPYETQQDFAFALKVFHENSKITFIIVAVWREENRLILFNGDLTGRVIPIDADAWDDTQLNKVMSDGEHLLNIQLPSQFKSEVIKGCSESVYIVQEVCHRACTESGLHETASNFRNIIPTRAPLDYIQEIVREQSGRYKVFLQNFSFGFQTTDLEMYKWILFPIIKSNVDLLEKGLSYNYIKSFIESKHPEGNRLKPGNLTQALQLLSKLQIAKNFKPFILDYDSANLLLSIVDKGFLIWLSGQDRSALLELIDLPVS